MRISRVSTSLSGFGVHGGIKAFYGVEPPEDVPATLDYMVGSVGG